MTITLIAQILVLLGFIGLLILVLRVGTTLEKVFIILGLVAALFLMFHG